MAPRVEINWTVRNVAMKICPCVVLCIVSVASLLGAEAPPDVAYSVNGVLFFATRSGAVMRTIRTRLPIRDFTVSPDLERVIFISKDATDWGGPLYLFDAKANTVQLLTAGPYWLKRNTKAAREVYSDPDFSPDGAKVVFAIHTTPSGDLVEASGPLASMNLKTRQVKVLRSTTEFDSVGPAFANHPSWSPDGTHILVSFEIGFSLVPPNGSTIRSIEPQQLPEESDWDTGFGWLGNGCVLYGFGHDGMVQGAAVLHLSSGRSNPISSLLGTRLGNGSVIEMIQASGSLMLVSEKDGSQLYDIVERKQLATFPRGAKLLNRIPPSVAGCDQGQ